MKYLSGRMSPSVLMADFQFSRLTWLENLCRQKGSFPEQAVEESLTDQ